MIGIDPCNLCPRMCGALRSSGQKGFCGAGGAMQVARAALHYWEEPPISGESGSGTVFFSGCSLKCTYCQNAVIAQGGIGPAIDVARLSEICLELEGVGALNVNFVTPTHYTPFIIDAVARARDAGLSVPIVWNTSGYECVQTIEALDGTVDVYLADFKYADASLAERYSHARDYPETALAALQAMLKQVGRPEFGMHRRADAPSSEGELTMTKGVVVRHLLLPGALDASKKALKMLYGLFGDEVLYSIMNQYTPIMPENERSRFPELFQTVPSSQYEELLDFADALGMEDYFWQDGPAAAESFIPSWNGEGVLASSQPGERDDT